MERPHWKFSDGELDAIHCAIIQGLHDDLTEAAAKAEMLEFNLLPSLAKRKKLRPGHIENLLYYVGRLRHYCREPVKEDVLESARLRVL